MFNFIFVILFLKPYADLCLNFDKFFLLNSFFLSSWFCNQVMEFSWFYFFFLIFYLVICYTSLKMIFFFPSFTCSKYLISYTYVQQISYAQLKSKMHSFRVFQSILWGNSCFIWEILLLDLLFQSKIALSWSYCSLGKLMFLHL